MNEDLSKHMSRIFGDLQRDLSHESFKDWIFVLGTVVVVRVDKALVTDSLDRANLSYYNFAPVQIGGEKRMLVHFKHHISTLDFPALPPGDGMPPPFPVPKRGPCVNSPFGTCRLVYGKFTVHDIRTKLGFDADEVLHDGIFEVKRLRIGLEICLDHMLGELVLHLGPSRSVDVHLISSAGMNIASGLVATVQGGPVFIADGFARTSMCLNMFGKGRDFAKLLDGHKRYDVGVVYGADSMEALAQWASSVIYAFSGSNFGAARTSGYGTLPGGFGGADAGFNFTQTNAFGKNWFKVLDGVFDVASYDEAQHIFSVVQDDIKTRLESNRSQLFDQPSDGQGYFPTIDMYGPIPLIVK